MTKTMGQIAYEASSTFLASEYLEDATLWDSELPGVKGMWTAGADAVLEAIASDAEHCAGLRQNCELMQLHVTDRLVAQQQGYALREFAARIRSLKSTKEV
jgi:hypothetical protein